MAEIVCGKDVAKEIAKIPLSNNVVKSRINEMSTDIRDQVLSDLKKSKFKFSLGLDESTDVAQCAELLEYVRYFNVCLIKEEFLFCLPLIQTTKAIDIFNLIDNFFKSNDLSNWTQLIGWVCCDGAPAMLGNKSGFSAIIKQHSPNIIVTHCLLHRHAFATKTLPDKLLEVMNISVKVVNFIRSRAKNHRLFKVLCESMNAEHNFLLYYTSVRWLSKGHVFEKFVHHLVLVRIIMQIFHTLMN